VNLATKLSQSAAESQEVISGTHKYLTGNLPSDICSKFRSSNLESAEILEQKKELWRELSFNPKSSSNSFKTSMITLMESDFAAENMRRSSTKHKWVRPKAWHQGCKPNRGKRLTASFKSKESTSIANTKR
jgi:hypothetical protein